MVVTAVVGYGQAAVHTPAAVASEAIVGFKHATTAREVCASHGLILVREYPNLDATQPTAHVRSTTQTTAEIIARLQADPSVAFAEPNYRRTLAAMPVPNDPQFRQQWPLRNTGQYISGDPNYSGIVGTPGADLHFLTAWGMAKPDPAEIVVAVLDSGIDLTHPDLAPNLWTHPGEIAGDGLDNDFNGLVDDAHGYDFADGDPDPTDQSVPVNHGTHLSGIIAATANNSQGIAGTAFHARVMPLKITHSDIYPAIDAILAAIDYAVMMKNRGVNIVALNASYSSVDESSAERAAIEAAATAGIVFCTAAGNNSSDNTAAPVYPANYRLSNMIVVAASDSNDQIADFSNYGIKVDLAAPGVNIYSTKPATSVARGYTRYAASELALSGTTPGLTGALYYCGYGATAADFPPAVNGSIALIQRGPTGVTYATKVTNAMNAGAAAAIIFNNVSTPPVAPSLGSPGAWIPALFISQADGQALLASLPTSVNVTVVTTPYFFASGTSTAAPFVSAAVAFAARNFPNESASQRVARILNGVTPVGYLTGKVITGGRLNLAGIVDPGANAIPDWWETQYFNTVGIDPAGDPDGDRFSNLQEYLIGTQPTNPASMLTIAESAIVQSGAALDFRITFPTATDVSYRVEFNDPLTGSSWQALGSDLSGTGTPATVTDPNAVNLHPTRIYRVRITAP